MISKTESIILLRTAVAGFMLIGLAFSQRAWLTSSRTFPTVPLIPNLPPIPSPFDYAIPIALSVFLILITVGKRIRLFTACFLGTLALAVLFDQTRLQPWCYQYALMLVALNFVGPGEDGENAALNCCRLIIAATYFYSGLHKLNGAFAEQLGWLLTGGGALTGVPAAALYTIALAESLLGIALLIPRTRVPAAVAAVIMHAAILAMLGPERLNANSVVWPWNLAMMLFLIVLFIVVKGAPLGCLRANKAVAMLTVALFWVAPLFSFFGLWDSYLSSALYSGDVWTAELDISALPQARAHMLPGVEQEGTRTYIDVHKWALEDINVAAYPEKRTHRYVAEKLRQRLGMDHLNMRLTRGTYIWQPSNQSMDETITVGEKHN